MPKRVKSVERTKDGLEILRDAYGKIRAYRAVVDVAPPGAPRKQQTITLPTAKEVRAERARITTEREQGTLVVRDRTITVRVFLTEWLASREKAGNLKPGTVTNYRNALVHVIDAYGDMRLQELTVTHIERLRDEMRSGQRRRRGKAGEPLGSSMVNLMLTTLTMALRAAKRRKLVAVNVAELVENIATDETERAPWPDAEAEKFLRHLSGHRLFAIFLMSMLGLRRGEVMGMQWKRDVNLTPRPQIGAPYGTITVLRNAPLVAGKRVEGTPKRRRSRRTLPLPRVFAVELAALQLQQQKETAEHADWYPVEKRTDYVVVDELGQPLHPGSYSRMFKREVVAAGVSARTLHEARNTCASILANDGVPLIVIAAWLGQSAAQLAITEGYIQIDLSAISAAHLTLDVKLSAMLAGVVLDEHAVQVARLCEILAGFPDDVVCQVLEERVAKTT